MATQKPISTISYNTEPFLREKLENLYEKHIIQGFMYIKHKGEDGDKDHIHLRIEPNTRIDPMNLTELFKEFEAGKDKPLCVRPWRPSKEEDWVLYAVHDQDYLSSKYGGGEKGEKIPYNWTDIVANEGFDVEVAYIRARQSLKYTSANIAKRILSGSSRMELAQEGYNVFLINAMTRCVYEEVLPQLQEQNEELKRRIHALISFLTENRIYVKFDDTGFPIGLDNRSGGGNYEK